MNQRPTFFAEALLKAPFELVDWFERVCRVLFAIGVVVAGIAFAWSVWG